MIHKDTYSCSVNTYAILILGVMLWLSSSWAWAAQESGKIFQAVATDAQGVQTELENIIFYWEENISETSFIPHELRELPVKRGTSLIKIKFDAVKDIELKTRNDSSPPVATVTLKDGKTGEFQLAIAGSFKGQSSFGEVELPAARLSRVVYK